MRSLIWIFAGRTCPKTTFPDVTLIKDLSFNNSNSSSLYKFHSIWLVEGKFYTSINPEQKTAIFDNNIFYANSNL